MYSRGNPGEECEALKELAAPLGAWLAASYASEPDPDQGDQRQHEGVNLVDPLLYNSSTSQLDPDHGDQRQHEGVNPVDPLLYNSSNSQLDPDHGDQRLYEGVNTPFPPVDPLLYNSCTSELDPDQGDISQSDPDKGDQWLYADIDSVFPPDDSLPYFSSPSRFDPYYEAQLQRLWELYNSSRAQSEPACVNPVDTLYNPPTSQPDPDQGDQRHCEGVNPVDPFLYNPSRPQLEPECVNPVDTLYNPPPSQPDPVQGDQRLDECENPVDTLRYNSSTSQSDTDEGDQRLYEDASCVSTSWYSSSASESDSDQGDEGDQRHYEGVNTSLPPVSTLLSNPSTSQPDPDQQYAPSSAHPSRARTCPTSIRKLRSKKNPRYTKEQEEAIRSLKDDNGGKTWPEVGKAYNVRRYPDGTFWEVRTWMALKRRYHQCQSGKEQKSSTSPPITCPTNSGYTKEQEEAILSLKANPALSWSDIVQAYNRRCYSDGTPWEPRSIGALQKRFYDCQSPSSRESNQKNTGYTKQQEKALRSLKESRTNKKTWEEIGEAYNARCYPDGTPWEPRTVAALKQRYQSMKAQKTHKSTSPDCAQKRGYTREQDEAIRSLKEDGEMSWEDIEAEYNSRCYADGKPWKQRTAVALMKRFHNCFPPATKRRKI